MEVMQITPTENRLLLLIKEGKKSREIAHILRTTPTAIRMRLSRFYAKSGFNTREEALAYYYENIHPKQTQQ